MMQGEEESENQASQVNNSSQQNQGKESLFEVNDGGEDKQQLLDNLDDVMVEEQAPKGRSDLSANKVGDVIG